MVSGVNAIYARAKDDETEDLNGQIARCRARAALKGVLISGADIYTDAGGWEFGSKRIGLRTLTEGVDSGDISAVYVDTLGRLGRSVDVIPILEKWQRKGVPVIVVSDRIRAGVVTAP
jgi:DNA invertase Pin-like site-specific DNA recombinase